jgi:hypothetical protein
MGRLSWWIWQSANVIWSDLSMMYHLSRTEEDPAKIL